LLKHLQSREDWNQKSLGAKGFTLVELLVVIVILGILAAVVVFAVSGITDRGKTNACKTEVRTVKTAVEAYNAEFGVYPNSTGVLIGAGTGRFLESTPTYVTVGTGGALSKTAAGNEISACTV
jgi:prepilin-type N-terminal cleavage/methylation domain-containing protein